MKAFKTITLLLVLFSILLIACGGGGATTTAAPQELWRPDWWMDQDSTEFVFSYGEATGGTSRTARASAFANAQAQAAFYVEARVQAMIRDFISETGVNNP
jgi:hypothetical protein